METNAVKITTKLPKPRVIRLNLTIPEKLYSQLATIIDRQGYIGPSDYFQARIRKDADLEPAA